MVARKCFWILLLAITLLSLSQSFAQSLGISPEALRLKSMISVSCLGCHIRTSQNPTEFLTQFGDFSKAGVLNRYAGIGTVNSSVLFNLVETDRMPPAGKVSGRLTPSQKSELLSAIKNWIEKGAPLLEPDVKPTRKTETDVLNIIEADLKKEKTPTQVRYVSLLHLFNNPKTNVRLQKVREAIAKLTNSLSWEHKLVVPQILDADGVVLKISLSNYTWTAEKWKTLEATYPYFTDFWGQSGVNRVSIQNIVNQTGSRVPIVRGDWFVANLSAPPLYNVFLSLPKTDRELEGLLGVNVVRDIEFGNNIIRWGFSSSGVSQHNRMIERHGLQENHYYWRSYDFNGDIDNKDIRKSPLGPGNGPNQFKHGGGEIIFSLPNGLQGYMLVEGKGNRIDTAPIDIVSDIESPNRAVINGVSCMRCHSEGIIRKADQVNTEENIRNFNQATAEGIETLYSSKQFPGIFERDIETFKTALKNIGIQDAEPIRDVVSLYNSPLDRKDFLNELGLTDDIVSDVLKRSFEKDPNGVLSSTFLQTLKRAENGIKRPTVEQIFPNLQLALIQDYVQLNVPDFISKFSRKPRSESRPRAADIQYNSGTDQ